VEQSLGEERALEIIRELEEVFGVTSPYRDSIIEILDYEKQLYAVANLHKLVVVRAGRLENKLIYKERVTIGAPVEVTVYTNPIGGVTKYRVRWETLTRPLIIGPATIEEIAERIKAEGLVISHRILQDVLNAVIEGFIRKQRAEIVEEIEYPGFYLVEGRIVPVRIDVKEPSGEELREALKLLDELADRYKHILEKFATIMKWGVAAPFSYVYKQKGKWMKWLYLYGASKTGKSTLGEIILAFFGLDPRHVKTGGSIDTPARIGYVLSQSTYPILVNEPGGALAREDVVEIIKNAVESPLARGKYNRGSYIEIPALAPLILTSNKYLPKDDAVLRRLTVLRFTYGERISQEKAVEFERKVKPRIKELRAIGDFAVKKVVENPEMLEKGWEELAIQLLIDAYTAIGLQPPEWIKLRAGVDEGEIYEDMVELVRGFLLERINNEFNRLVGRVTVEKSESIEFLGRGDIEVEERINIVLEKRLIPWLLLKKDTVIVTTGIMHELQELIGDIGGLKSLAELLGWEYTPKYSFKEGGKVRSVSVIQVQKDEFTTFLAPKLEG